MSFHCLRKSIREMDFQRVNFKKEKLTYLMKTSKIGE